MYSHTIVPANKVENFETSAARLLIWSISWLIEGQRKERNWKTIDKQNCTFFVRLFLQMKEKNRKYSTILYHCAPNTRYQGKYPSRK